MTKKSGLAKEMQTCEASEGKLAARPVSAATRTRSVRWANSYNIGQAIDTAGIVIPTPITQTTYWHRSFSHG